MQEILKKHADKLRFLIVGGTNTILDFDILFSLTIFLNIPKEFANFISTFVAFLFSFFANKKYTFKSTSQNLKKQFLLFASHFQYFYVAFHFQIAHRNYQTFHLF